MKIGGVDKDKFETSILNDHSSNTFTHPVVPTQTLPKLSHIYPSISSVIPMYRERAGISLTQSQR
jgi:hypothetical protein